MSEFHILTLKETISEIKSWSIDAQNILLVDMFGDRDDCIPEPYKTWLSKIEESIKQMDSITNDPQFKKMVKEEDAEYDRQCDMADGQSY